MYALVKVKVKQEIGLAGVFMLLGLSGGASWNLLLPAQM